MSIRLRLAASYTLVFGAVLAFLLVATYALHMRDHFDQVDQGLVLTARHLALDARRSMAEVQRDLPSGNSGPVARVYDADGKLDAASPDGPPLPLTDPRSVTRAPSAPDLARAVPGFLTLPVDARGGTFGLLTTPAGRWRIYVRPISAPHGTSGYVEVLFPLRALDRSGSVFSGLLGGLWVLGVLIGFLACWLIAGRVLHPLGSIVHTAREIALSRNFAGRLPAPPTADEFRQMVATFNEMLAGLAEAYEAQRHLVADASHELRTPLTAIRGNAELLRLAHPDGEDEPAVLEIEREAARLMQLVDNFLTVAEMDAHMVALRRRPVDLAEVLAETLPAAQRLARGQELTLQAVGPVVVDADADRIRQLVLILLDNALKYSVPGGRVVLGLNRFGDTAEITVHDSGIGIPADDLPHVFERMYRGEHARRHHARGTGLGLHIAQWIAAAHGGVIQIESQVDRGTTATVRLPAAPS